MAVATFLGGICVRLALAAVIGLYFVSLPIFTVRCSNAVGELRQCGENEIFLETTENFNHGPFELQFFARISS